MGARTRFLIRRAMPFVLLAPAALVAVGALAVQGAYRVGRVGVDSWWILLRVVPVGGWIALRFGSPALDEQRQIALRTGTVP